VVAPRKTGDTLAAVPRFEGKRAVTAMFLSMALAIVVIVGGCGGSGGSGTEHEPVRESDDRACFDKLGEPLKAADLVAAFEAEGFTMYSLPKADFTECDGAGVDGVANVTNRRSVADDDTRSIRAADEKVSDREGWVTCGVSRDTVFRTIPQADLNKLYADLDVGPYSPFGPSTKAEFLLANVSCTHYPPGDDADVWTGRALAAMKRLERQLVAG
jgi:hypothetical protein